MIQIQRARRAEHGNGTGGLIPSLRNAFGRATHSGATAAPPPPRTSVPCPQRDTSPPPASTATLNRTEHSVVVQRLPSTSKSNRSPSPRPTRQRSEDSMPPTTPPRDTNHPRYPINDEIVYVVQAAYPAAACLEVNGYGWEAKVVKTRDDNTDCTQVLFTMDVDSDGDLYPQPTPIATIGHLRCSDGSLFTGHSAPLPGATAPSTDKAVRRMQRDALDAAKPAAATASARTGPTIGACTDRGARSILEGVSKSTNIRCPRCTTVCRNRSELGIHLADSHGMECDANSLLATHGFATCPKQCCQSRAYCLLPRGGANGTCGFHLHVSRASSSVIHSEYNKAHGGASNITAGARRNAAGLAPAGSTGALLSALPGIRAPTDAVALNDIEAPPTPTTTYVPNVEPDAEENENLNSDITTLSKSMDLLADFGTVAESHALLKECRGVARKLHFQGVPSDKRQCVEIIAGIVACHEVYAEDVESDRGGLYFMSAELACAYVFARPSDDKEPYTVPVLRQRADTWNRALNNGSAGLLWSNFVAPLVTVEHASDADAALDAQEGDCCEYDGTILEPSEKNMLSPDDIVRKIALKAAHGEWNSAWTTASPSPALDPRKPSSRQKLADLNRQKANKPLTAEHFSLPPGGQKPISFSANDVKKAGRGLSDLKAAGSMPEDNRIIKCILECGGLKAVTCWMNEIACDRAHPLARDILAGSIRAALIAKVDDCTGMIKGARPLGITEKWRCLFWAIVNLLEKKKINRILTRLPERDRADQDTRVAAAEAKLLQANLEAEAASSSGVQRRNKTAAAAASALADLDKEKLPLKFVTNFCYAPQGTEKLGFMVRGWCESTPTGACISDDVSNMYNTVCRWRSVESIKHHFPELLLAYRFFYMNPPIIWFGGKVVYVTVDADGKATLAKEGDAGAQILRSIEGGCQGDGGATLWCVLPYHDDCCEAQRQHQDVDMAATADDFYCFSDTKPAGGGQAPIYAADQSKRKICKEGCNVDSNMDKACIYTKAGTLRHAPTYLPGGPGYTNPDSAKQAAGRLRILCFRVAGLFIGDPATCSEKLCALLTRKLAPLEHVANMCDTEKVSHSSVLAYNLVRLVASAIPTHWMRGMPPDQTKAAAVLADAKISDAMSKILRAADSPDERQALALETCKLPLRIGGLGTASFTHLRTACFCAAFVTAWATCSAVNPTLQQVSIEKSNAPTIVGFRDAWSALQQTLADVRRQHTALDTTTVTWCTGHIAKAFHPFLSKSLLLPKPWELFAAGCSSTKNKSRFSQRALSNIIHCNQWLTAKKNADTFDSGNVGNSNCLEREASRLISCSQEGAGMHLTRLPDSSVKGSIVISKLFTTILQRRVSLYLSTLTPLYNQIEAWRTTTQHERLGDGAINDAHHGPRHKALLIAIHNMMKAVVTSDTVPGSIRLGDRGDGTTEGKQEAAKRYAYLNEGHIPDIVNAHLWIVWEVRCMAVHVQHAVLGGSRENGGAASTAEGGTFATGNTLEKQIVISLGTKGHGVESDGPHQRSGPNAGDGWVRPSTDHQYVDAQSKKVEATLLLAENTGAFSPPLSKMLRILGVVATHAQSTDYTHYGMSRSSPHTFVQHHGAAISAAIVLSDALSVDTFSALLSQKLCSGDHC